MDQVEEIKSKTDIVQLVGEYVKLTKAGRNFKGLCPFHGEKTPSFMVNPELQIYKCFGCGEGGDAYAFLEKIEGVEFGEALKTLAKRAGITLESYVPTKGEEEKERLFRVNSLAAEYYHYLLTKHVLGKQALAYLKGRKISEEAIETFRLGFAPEGWDFLISFLHGKKNFSMNDLERTGLTVPSSQGGYDRFRNRVMFPLNNHRGQTVGFAGRILPGSNTEQAKYINTPETELYHKGDLLYGLDINKAEIKKKGRAIIVEGEIDLISSWMAGVENAVAIKGSALTGRQLELVYRLCDRLILSMDADLAGGSAARRGIELAEKAGCFVEVIDWSLAGEGTKDVADVVNENPAKWREMTEKTVSIYSFYIDSAIKKFGLTTEGKARVARDVLQFLDLISDEIRKDEYLKELAKKIEVETGILRVQMAKIRSPDTGLSGKETETKLIKSRRELVEEYVVGLAIRNKAVDRLTGKPVKDLIKGDFWKKITEFFSRSRKHSESIKEIVKELPAEMRAKVEELYLEEDDFKETPFDREWDKAIGELEELNVREKITALRATGKQENQPRELLELTGRLNDLTKGR